ncbi:MAG: DNA-binding protein [Bacillota bacterium]|nr:DNA-binding protein [Bacillota bacterium]
MRGVTALVSPTDGELRWASGGLGRVLVARMGPGVELLRGLTELVEREGLRYAVILGGAASLRQVRLRNVRVTPETWPIRDTHRVFVDLPGPLELLSISGNVSRRPDGSIHLHAHVVVSTGGQQPGLAYGGHLVEGAVVLSTAEIAVAEITGIALSRRMDGETRTLELFPERA